MSDALALLVAPFAAAVVFVLMHAYLGVHVLRRRIVFADLALAQLSALGATLAFAGGHAPASAASFGYAMLFTAIGAAIFTAIRGLSRHVSQEAFVGIVYVVATAATIMVVDRLPQGAEHVKKMLVGSILTVDYAELAKIAALYAAVGVVHWFARKPLLALSTDAPHATRGRIPAWAWDFAFFVSFGVVVTSSVATAGVLLVFSLLIVPAVIGSIFSQRLMVVLAIAWAVGTVACAAGLVGSYMLDLPTGASMVGSLAAFLVAAGVVRVLVFVRPEQRRANVRAATRALAAAALATLLASCLWLMINPAGDQPLLALAEHAAGTGPGLFLEATERDVYENAIRDAVRFQGEADRLDAMEKAARYQGAPLSDDELRRIASYQQSFNEMTRGERFVQDTLRAKARARERWLVGVPLALVAVLGLAWLARRFHKTHSG